MAAAYDNLDADDNELDTDGEEDIDDFTSSAVPLLSESGELCEEEAESADAASLPIGYLKPTGLRSLFSKKRTKRGVCPLCGQVVRSGTHFCLRAEEEVREGQSADAARSEGNAHFRAGRHREAVAAYAEALQHTPKDARVWSNRAAAYMALGRKAEALSDAEVAMQLAPAWPKGYIRKALILESEGNWGSAGRVYELMISKCEDAEAQPNWRRRLVVARARSTIAARVREMPAPFCDTAVRARRQNSLRAGAEKDLDVMECSRRLDLAREAKVHGNRNADVRDWEAARTCYLRGLHLLDFCAAQQLDLLELSPSDVPREQARLEAALMLNQALCEGHLGAHSVAADLCASVLELDPSSTKARYRRAQALTEMQEFDAALEEVYVGLAQQPDESALLSLLYRVQVKRQSFRRREKAQFANMFSAKAV